MSKKVATSDRGLSESCRVFRGTCKPKSPRQRPVHYTKIHQHNSVVQGVGFPGCGPRDLDRRICGMQLIGCGSPNLLHEIHVRRRRAPHDTVSTTNRFRDLLNTTLMLTTRWAHPPEIIPAL